MSSIAIRVFLSLVIPLIVWLAYGQPAVDQVGNVALCITALALVMGMVWHDFAARIFNSDLVTYGLVSYAINVLFAVIGLVLIAVLFYSKANGFPSFGDVPGLAWAALLALLLISWLIPMATSNRVSELPGKPDRREWERPSKT